MLLESLKPKKPRQIQAHQFLITHYESDPDGKVKINDIYELYEKWCRKHRIIKQNKANLGTILTLFGIKHHGYNE